MRPSLVRSATTMPRSLCSEPAGSSNPLLGPEPPVDLLQPDGHRAVGVGDDQVVPAVAIDFGHPQHLGLEARVLHRRSQGAAGGLGHDSEAGQVERPEVVAGVGEDDVVAAVAGDVAHGGGP